MQKKFKILRIKSLRNVEKDIFHEEWLLNSKKGFILYGTAKKGLFILFVLYSFKYTEKSFSCMYVEGNVFLKFNAHCFD